MKKESVERKVLDIKLDFEKLLRYEYDGKFWILTYGAVDISPKNLVFLICVLSDKAKYELKKNRKLIDELRNILVKHNYPNEGIQHVQIDFESQETVDRESKGSWRDHLQ